MATENSICLSKTDRARLGRIVSDRNSAQKHVWRAQIVLASADGLGTVAVMRAMGKAKKTVWRWQERFLAEGVDGLLRDATRPPGTAPVAADKVADLVRRTQAPPPHEATHWTARAMAQGEAGRQTVRWTVCPPNGLAVSTLQTIWKAHGLAPHRWRVFKLSRDPEFAKKLHDVVGLSVGPPAHAVVLSVDETSQIQALDRTQPGLPLKRGRAGTMTHEYKRNRTTTLFAALNTLTGEVFGRTMARHPLPGSGLHANRERGHQAFIRFLNALERKIPAGNVVHVVLDTVATHKTPEVMRWLERHPRSTFHFTPTSASWLNAPSRRLQANACRAMVEGFFAKLTKRRLKRGVFHSLVDLQSAINRFIAEHNETEARPFTWRADPDAIIAARSRGVQALEANH
ncbi:MAG: IS630 family transposase [Pseudomonadota bacterium]